MFALPPVVNSLLYFGGAFNVAESASCEFDILGQESVRSVITGHEVTDHEAGLSCFSTQEAETLLCRLSDLPIGENLHLSPSALLTFALLSYFPLSPFIRLSPSHPPALPQQSRLLVSFFISFLFVHLFFLTTVPKVSRDILQHLRLVLNLLPLIFQRFSVFFPHLIDNSLCP